MWATRSSVDKQESIENIPITIYCINIPIYSKSIYLVLQYILYKHIYICMVFIYIHTYIYKQSVSRQNPTPFSKSANCG